MYRVQNEERLSIIHNLCGPLLPKCTVSYIACFFLAVYSPLRISFFFQILKYILLEIYLVQYNNPVFRVF